MGERVVPSPRLRFDAAAEAWLTGPVPELRPSTAAAYRHAVDAEEARDLLRHKNSTVTRAVYRAHFDQRRREALRARMEAANGSSSQQPPTLPVAEVLDLREVRSAAQ